MSQRRGGLKTAFSTLKSGSKIRKIGPKPEIDFQWIAYFLSVLNDSRIYNDKDLRVFFKDAHESLGVTQSDFVRWLSRNEFSIGIRTIQQVRNSITHKGAKDNVPVDFPLVTLIDDFFHRNLREIVEKSGYIDN